MNEFHRMTIIASTEVISGFQSHSDIDVLEVHWGITGRCSDSCKSTRVADLSGIACGEDVEFRTESRQVHLSSALIEIQSSAGKHQQLLPTSRRLVAKLQIDMVEARTEPVDVDSDACWRTNTAIQLVGMPPSYIREPDFRRTESEVMLSSDRHGFRVAKGHLKRAVSAISRGEWSSANGELRNLYECYLNDIATSSDYTDRVDGKARQDYVGSLQRHFCLQPTTSGLVTSQIRIRSRGL